MSTLTEKKKKSTGGEPRLPGPNPTHADHSPTPMNAKTLNQVTGARCGGGVGERARGGSGGFQERPAP